MSADLFIAINRLPVKRLSLYNWLEQLERVVSPEGKIIICPQWSVDADNRIILDIHNNPFTRIMLDNGYIILPEIEYHNDSQYPITFYKDKSIIS